MQLIRCALFLLVLIASIATTVAAEEGGADSGVDNSILGAEFLESNDNSDDKLEVNTPIHKEKKQTLELKLLAYNQKDGGGIEEIDEDASIFETVIIYTNKVTEVDTLSFRLLGDVVSSASIKREHNASYRSLQSGASGTVYVNLNTAWQHERNNWRYTLNSGFGKEYAYQSINVGAGAVGEFNQKNTTFGVNLQIFADSVGMIRFNGIDEDDEGRDSVNLELNLTQILTPRSLLHFTLFHSSQSGFLATQFNSVFVNGIEDYEVLPDSRQRTSVTGRYKQAINNNMAYEIGLRYYTDDWGIDGKTLDTRFFQYVAERTVLLEYQYRYYTQDAADYYQERFTAAQAYQTSDPDLGDFSGHMFGLKSTFKERVIMGQTGEWDIGAYYYTRDNGIDMMWLTSGFKISF